MENQKLSNYVTVPRAIMSDCRNGKITKPERNLLLFLRSSGNPFGIATVTLEGLADDVFNKPTSKNHINKLLLSLRSKRYIWYQDRTGRRGSFEVHMGDWILPDKKIKTLDHFFIEEAVRGSTLGKKESEPEVEAVPPPSSQRFKSNKTLTSNGFRAKHISESLRGLYNDTNTEKEKDNRSSSTITKGANLQTDRFVPQNYEEVVCLKIATQVNDRQIGFYLSVYRKHSTKVLEEAFVEFERLDGRHKNNPPAFYNSLVKQILNNRNTAAHTPSPKECTITL